MYWFITLVYHPLCGTYTTLQGSVIPWTAISGDYGPRQSAFVIACLGKVCGCPCNILMGGGRKSGPKTRDGVSPNDPLALPCTPPWGVIFPDVGLAGTNKGHGG